jgi:hypothetical protein
MAEEGYTSSPESDLPGPEALAEGFRAIIDECARNTADSRTLRQEASGISDDHTRRKIMQADGYDQRVASIAEVFDRHMPNPRGDSWLEEIGRRADIIEEERLADTEG